MRGCAHLTSLWESRYTLARAVSLVAYHSCSQRATAVQYCQYSRTLISLNRYRLLILYRVATALPLAAHRSASGYRTLEDDTELKMTSPPFTPFSEESRNPFANMCRYLLRSGTVQKLLRAARSVPSV